MEAGHSHPHSPGALHQHDSWTCPRCGWKYPNPHPSAKHRRNHKKRCGKIKGFELCSTSHDGGSSDDTSSDEEIDSHKKSGHETPGSYSMPQEERHISLLKDTGSSSAEHSEIKINLPDKEVPSLVCQPCTSVPDSHSSHQSISNLQSYDGSPILWENGDTKMLAQQDNAETALKSAEISTSSRAVADGEELKKEGVLASSVGGIGETPGDSEPDASSDGAVQLEDSKELDPLVESSGGDLETSAERLDGQQRQHASSFLSPEEENGKTVMLAEQDNAASALQSEDITTANTVEELKEKECLVSSVKDTGMSAEDSQLDMSLEPEILKCIEPPGDQAVQVEDSSKEAYPLIENSRDLNISAGILECREGTDSSPAHFLEEENHDTEMLADQDNTESALKSENRTTENTVVGLTETEGLVSSVKDTGKTAEDFQPDNFSEPESSKCIQPLRDEALQVEYDKEINRFFDSNGGDLGISVEGSEKGEDKFDPLCIAEHGVAPYGVSGDLSTSQTPTKENVPMKQDPTNENVDEENMPTKHDPADDNVHEEIMPTKPTNENVDEENMPMKQDPTSNTISLGLEDKDLMQDREVGGGLLTAKADELPTAESSVQGLILCKTVEELPKIEDSFKEDLQSESYQNSSGSFIYSPLRENVYAEPRIIKEDALQDTVSSDLLSTGLEKDIGTKAGSVSSQFIQDSIGPSFEEAVQSGDTGASGLNSSHCVETEKSSLKNKYAGSQGSPYSPSSDLHCKLASEDNFVQVVSPNMVEGESHPCELSARVDGMEKFMERSDLQDLRAETLKQKIDNPNAEKMERLCDKSERTLQEKMVPEEELMNKDETIDENFEKDSVTKIASPNDLGDCVKELDARTRFQTRESCEEANELQPEVLSSIREPETVLDTGSMQMAPVKAVFSERSDSLETETYEDAPESFETGSVGGSVDENEMPYDSGQLKDGRLEGQHVDSQPVASSGEMVSEMSMKMEIPTVLNNSSCSIVVPEKKYDMLSKERFVGPSTTQDLKAPSPEAWQELGTLEVGTEDNEAQAKRSVQPVLKSSHTEVREQLISEKEHTPLRSLLAKEGVEKSDQNPKASSEKGEEEKLEDNWGSHNDQKPKTRSIWSHCICCPAVH